MQIGLANCTKSKRQQASRPAELYMESPLFRKIRAYCEMNHDRWYILSAKHHLLAPDGPVIDPYDETLSGTAVNQKRAWARETFEQLSARGLLGDDTQLVIHAGRDYYDELLPLLEETRVSIQIPTKGLRMGETLAWYNDQL